MKDKKGLVSRLEIITIMFICFLGLVTFGQQAVAKTKTKTITIEKGKTYQLKLKKGSKIICKNKKISKVTKTGKIKALKEGKCTIKVKRGKNIKKYIIHVKEIDSIIPTPTPIPTPIPSPAPTASPTGQPLPTTAPGGCVYVNSLLVDHIEEKDDTTSIVYLTVIEQESYVNKDKVKKYKIEYPNERLADIKIGDKVSLLYHVFEVTQEIEDGTNTINGPVSITRK